MSWTKCSLKDRPEKHETKELVRRTNGRKAFGEDGLPTALVKAASAALADVWHPLWCKCVITQSEPVQWKGGMLQELWKGKGTQAELRNWRGVVLEDAGAKCFHKWAVTKLEAQSEKYLRSSQFGCRKVRNTHGKQICQNDCAGGKGEVYVVGR